MWDYVEKQEESLDRDDLNFSLTESKVPTGIVINKETVEL